MTTVACVRTVPAVCINILNFVNLLEPGQGPHCRKCNAFTHMFLLLFYFYYGSDIAIFSPMCEEESLEIRSAPILFWGDRTEHAMPCQVR